MNLVNKEQKYFEFASNIHFFEFIQEEFKEPHFKIEKYDNEIKEISAKSLWNVKELSKLLREYPKCYEIFEEIFQLARFTNVQMIHFLFNIKILNSIDKNKLIDYLKQNLEYDARFFKVFIDTFKKNKIKQLEFKEEFNNKDKLIPFIHSVTDEMVKNCIIMLFKTSVINYVKLSIKDVKVIHERLKNKNLIDVSERVAEYLIRNLLLNDILKSVRIKEFLMAKRIPRDTKGIHGNFGIIKILALLKNHGFLDGNVSLDKNNIKTLPLDMSDDPKLKQLKGKFVFVREKYIEGINKIETGKPKKFDIVLVYDLKPKILIETNFYSTAGTKIGINRGEYVNLNNNIKENFKQFAFMWITDGNYWLTTTGKNMLLGLYDEFGENVLNYNLLDKRLEKIKQDLIK